MQPRTLLVLGAIAIACSETPPSSNTAKQESKSEQQTASPVVAVTAVAPRGPSPTLTDPAADDPTRTAGRPANELGLIPILEYHLIGEEESRWTRQRERFRLDLELLYDRGYRPVSVSELANGRIDLPAGLSPVVFTFDDASPSQFRYIERNGRLELDPTSALGIWLDFRRERPDWENAAVFCLLSGAEAGRSFFGNKGIEGQKTEWRFRKIRSWPSRVSSSATTRSGTRSWGSTTTPSCRSRSRAG